MKCQRKSFRPRVTSLGKAISYTGKGNWVLLVFTGREPKLIPLRFPLSQRLLKVQLPVTGWTRKGYIMDTAEKKKVVTSRVKKSKYCVTEFAGIWEETILVKLRDRSKEHAILDGTYVHMSLLFVQFEYCGKDNSEKTSFQIMRSVWERASTYIYMCKPACEDDCMCVHACAGKYSKEIFGQGTWTSREPQKLRTGQLNTHYCKLLPNKLKRN